MNKLISDEVAATALVGLRSMTRRSLASLLRSASPSALWSQLTALPSPSRWSDRESPSERVRSEARAVDVALIQRSLRAAQATAIAIGDDRYPDPLRVGDDPPPVLFARGDIGMLNQRAVAIVGTRRATAAGRATAFELGRELASEGVIVVSGLAAGIDAQGHRGAIASGERSTVAVLGSGIDVCYPRQHRELFDVIGDRHLLLSEWPPATEPVAFRFPLRNRVIAALSTLVVVVESRERGGSLITAQHALERGIDVMAVPAHPRSATSLGTNRLIRDGAAPVTSIDDVFDVLGLHRVQRVQLSTHMPAQSAEARAILDVLDSGPATFGRLSQASGLSLVETAVHLGHLLSDAQVIESAGWFESTRSWLMTSEAPQ